VYRKASAFSLVEILVVIAVIVILAAIVLPVLISSRLNGQKTTCLSNMRQLGAATLMYAQDNDTLFPEGTQPYAHDVAMPDKLGGKPSGIGWAGQVFPYVKNVSVFACPDDTTKPLASHGLTTYAVSYALNSGYSANIFPPVSPLKASTGSSNLVLLAEVKGAWAAVTLPDEGASRGATMFSPAGDALSILLANPDPLASRVTAPIYTTGDLDRGGPNPMFGSPRHGNGANYLMTDGHVKWLPPAVVCQPFPYWMQSQIPNCTVEF